MTKIKYILLLFISVFILTKCQKHSKSQFSKNNTELITYFENDLLLTGKGKSEVASHYLDWSIQILDNDSIILLSSLKESAEDFEVNNRQYFGRLKNSINYSYDISISDNIYADGCNKPFNNYLDTDTIPFYIDKTLLNSVGFFKLKADTNEDTLIINNTNFLYKTNLKDSEKSILMSIIPNKKSGLYPISIESGLRCAVNIGNDVTTSKYSLNKIDGKYQLIIDRTIPNDMVDKECDYCIKKVNLDVVEK